MKPPDDIKKPGVIWKLKKLLYRLDDASWKFWLRVKEFFMQLELKVMDSDEAFYNLHDHGVLKEAVITHVENFYLASIDKFVDDFVEIVDHKLTVSQVESDKFPFTGLNISAVQDRIDV